ncbi:MAG: CPBP family intramembrane glutamic endopeptidase [Verrucomicrobiota bacterium]|nr:CPBP family intramembrane glutamic endopeptidase [Verrucomicrobiota bacterium]
MTFVGLALIFIYEKTDNLLAPILAHAFFNAVNVALILMASKGIPDTGMIQ